MIRMNIKEVLEDRRITSLYHFTRVENLESILNYGLLARTSLDNNNIYYKSNDSKRYDNHLNAVCVSISFPNYRMFYSYSKYRRDDWCVMEIDPRILYEKECLFCIENGASSNERRKDDNNKKGVNALEKLFYDDHYRKSVNLESEMPTNPQSEVLVLNKIETENIKSINFYTDDPNFNIYEYPDYDFFEDKELFKYRNDYENWR